MKRCLPLLLVVFIFFSTAEAQVYRFRVSANTGMFLGEVGKAEVKPPVVISHPGSSDFSPALKPGIELEIIRPVSTDFEMGLQLGYMNLYGETPTAPLYNFFLSRRNPLPLTYKYPKEALFYDTHLFSLSGTARWYFLPYSKELNLFMKMHGGVTFTGTDFTFTDRRLRISHDVGMIYSQGTQSNEEPKMAGISAGLGLGATYRLSDKLDVYLDVSASGIHSDIVNGVPNFNFVIDEEKTSMQRTNAISVITHGSIGIIYSAIPDRRISKSNITRSTHVSKSFTRKKSSYNKKKRR